MTRLVAILLFVLSGSAAAQGRGGGRDAQPKPDIPKEHRPPPGMCRIWIDDVPANQQPAPTDCATAVKNRPNNGRVIFGDDYVKPKDRKTPSLIKGFKEEPKKPDSARAPDKRKPDIRKILPIRPPGVQ